MATARLTPLQIERMRPPEAGQLDVYDQDRPGFGVRVSYRGTKSFVFKFKLGGKSCRMTLGRFVPRREGGEPHVGGLLTLKEARALYQELRSEVDEGKDPRRKRQTGSKKFSDLVEQWLRMDQKELRTYDESVRIVRKYLKPAWDGRDVRDLDGQDVLDVIDPIAEAGTEVMSRRVQSKVHKFFQWCVGRRIVLSNPATGLAKHGKETARDRVLKDHEVKAFWDVVSEETYPFGPAAQLALLTGQRQAKISAMRWSDTDGIVWTIPRDEREKGTSRRLVLPPLAMAILDSLPRVKDQDLVFTTDGKVPIVGWQKFKKRLDPQLRFKEPWRWHDLRRTAATGMNELGAEPHIVESLLGHKLLGVAGVYNRAQYDEPKRVALERWADKIQEIVSGPKGGNVIPIRGAL